MPDHAIDDLPTPRVAGLAPRTWRLWTQRNATVTGGLCVRVATESAADPGFRAQWHCLAETVYESPAYFDAVRDADDGSAPIELLAVTRSGDGRLVAVVPVRRATWELGFRVGRIVLWRRPMPVLLLLGSGGAAPLSVLTAEALALFQQAQAVLLHAVPQGLGLWDELVNEAEGHGVCASMLSNWRACHTMPVPASIDAYLQLSSSKKRYNLKRQQRQLASACGALVLERLSTVAHVSELLAASAALPAAQKVLPRPAMLEALARHGLLLCYVLRAGDRVMGVIVGTRSADVLHVHNIFTDNQQRHLSVGSTIMQLAMEDIISMACFKLVDFGYGTPRHEFSSSHVLQVRAQVAVTRRGDAARHWFAAFRLFHVCTEYAIARVKDVRAMWRA